MRALMLLVAAMVMGSLSPAKADPMLTSFEYPHRVHWFAFESQGQDLAMAYMDIAPAGVGNGHTAVLLHGKNFCGATWTDTILALRGSGFRVIVPDQIGFCKSSKPRQYQYGLHQLAANTNALLRKIGVEKPIVIGHSMGGMLALRYSLMYGDEMRALAVINPIGLEDWRAKGVPIQTIDELYAGELKKTAEQIREYQRNTYYGGAWRPQYQRWVDMLAGMYAGKDGWLVAWSQALTSDMIFNQPVVHEFPNIDVPTLLLIGAKDTTAIGKGRAPEDVKKNIGKYDELGPRTARMIKNSKLVMFPDLGHSPQVQEPQRFNEALVANLEELLGKNAPAAKASSKPN